MKKEELIEIMALHSNQEYLWEAKQLATKRKLISSYNKHKNHGKTTSHRKTSKEKVCGDIKSINNFLDKCLKVRASFNKLGEYLDIPVYSTEAISESLTIISTQFGVKTWLYRGQIHIKI